MARRYADEHAGVPNCDIDVLRTLIGFTPPRIRTGSPTRDVCGAKRENPSGI